MHNYTLDERKMIAEYLYTKLNFKTLTLLNGDDVDAITESSVREEIDKLKKVTFGDIKNQVGTKFKLTRGGQSTFQICIHSDSEFRLLLNLDFATIYQLKDFDDDTPIEVINDN